MVAVYPDQHGSAGKYGPGLGVPFLVLVIAAQIGHKEDSFSALLPWEPCVPRGDDEGQESDGSFWNVGVLGIGDPYPKSDRFTISTGTLCPCLCRAGGKAWLRG